MTTTFALIGLVGTVLLVLSFILGEVFDSALDGIADTGGWLSGPGIAGFLAAFGFAGALAAYNGAGTLAASIIGLVAGLALGAIAGGVTRTLTKATGEDAGSSQDLVGATGIVSTPIPRADGFGQVRVRLNGHLMTFSASSADRVPIGSGTEVIVSAAVSATAVQVRTVGTPPTSQNASN